jgi:hypothetical protein
VIVPTLEVLLFQLVISEALIPYAALALNIGSDSTCKALAAFSLIVAKSFILSCLVVNYAVVA